MHPVVEVPVAVVAGGGLKGDRAAGNLSGLNVTLLYTNLPC